MHHWLELTGSEDSTLRQVREMAEIERVAKDIFTGHDGALAPHLIAEANPKDNGSIKQAGSERGSSASAYYNFASIDDTGLTFGEQRTVQEVRRDLKLPFPAQTKALNKALEPYTTPPPPNQDVNIGARGATPALDRIIDAATRGNPDPRVAIELYFDAEDRNLKRN
jgi:hypothetical protein